MDLLHAKLALPGANVPEIHRQMKQLQTVLRRQTLAKKSKENIPLYRDLLQSVQQTTSVTGYSTRYKSFSNETSASSELTVHPDKGGKGGTVNTVKDDIEQYCARCKVHVVGTWKNPLKVELSLLRANSAPPGMVRHMLANDFLRIPDLADTDYILVEANGDIQGSFYALLQMYKRMGFQYVGCKNEQLHTAIMAKNLETIEALAPGKQEDPFNYHVIMAQPIKTFRLWCTHFVHTRL